MSGKKKVLITISGIIGVIAAGIAGYLIFTSMMMSPEKIFKEVINTTYENFESMLTKEQVVNSNKLEVIGNLKFNTSLEELKVLSDYNFNFRSAANVETNQAEITLGLEKNYMTAIEVSAYLANKSTYVDIKDVTSKLLKVDSFIDLSELDTSSMSKDDIIYITKTIKDLYLNTLNKNQFEIKKETIDNAKLTVVTYKLDSVSGKQMVNSVIDGMLSNKDLLEKIAKISSNTISEIEQILKDTKEDNNGIKDENEFIVNLYLNGKDLVKVEVNDDVEVILNENKVTMTITDKEQNNLYKFEIAKTEDNYKISFEVEVDNNKVNGTLDIVYNEISPTTANGSIKLVMAMTSNGEKMDFGLDINYSLNTEFNFKEINTTDSIPFEQMSEEEQLLLLTKIMSLDFLSGLLDLDSGLTPEEM